MKRPAYAKQLLATRRAGNDPACVLVIFGHDWTPQGTAPVLAVRPDGALGLDWSCVAGLPVHVEDRTKPDDDPYDGEGGRRLYFMLGEIARLCAWLTFEAVDNAAREPAHTYAFLSRRWDAAARRWVWPAWWSEETDKRNAVNREQWHREVCEWLKPFATGQAA